jgi:spermidine synthase
MKARPAENHAEVNSGVLLLGPSLALAGFLAMAYEVSWQRMLSLALGATLRSSALVLSCYMLGMGLGSWLIGKMADRETSPSRLLGRLHWAMALSGLWGAGLLSLIPLIYRSIQGALASEFAVHLVAVAALLPGAVASGGMLPATASAHIADRRGLGAGIGLLYSLEALGSMAGVAGTGFLFIRHLGQTGTLAACLALNLAVGAMLWTVRPGRRGGVQTRKKTEGPDSPARWDARLLAIALAMGFVGMSLQVVWNRAVRTYLPNSTYTFTTVAAVYLAGLFTGNLVFRAAADRLRRLGAWLFLGLAALSVSIAIGVPLLARVPSLFLFPWAGLLSQPAARIFLPPLLVTFGLAFVPTALMGFCSPLACRLYADRAGGVGGDVGLWRGINTMGSALGPAAAGLALLPMAGVSRSVWLMAALTALAATAAAGLGGKRRLKIFLGTALASACLALSLALPPVMVLPPSLHREQGWGGQTGGSQARKDEVVYYRETAEGTVIVTEDARTGIRACFVNNSAVVGTTYDAIKAVKMLGHLPALLGGRPRRALVIGFGIGVTAATVASHPSVEEVDCVEITPGVRLAAPLFSEFNRGVSANPKIRFIDGDGRTYLNRCRKVYDLISADPTHPTLGCAQLYTRDDFRLCRNRLSPGGVICQYLPFHGLTPSEFAGAAAAFASVFPHSSLWLGHSHGVLVGSAGRLQVDFSVWRERVGSLDDPLFYKNPHALAACLIMDEGGIARLAAGRRPCTDDRNFLEYFDPAAKDPANWERNLSLALSCSDGMGSIFPAAGDSMLLARHRAGQAAFLEGLAAQNRGDRAGMVRGMQEAVRAAPENEEFHFLLQQEMGRTAR